MQSLDRNSCLEEVKSVAFIALDVASHAHSNHMAGMTSRNFSSTVTRNSFDSKRALNEELTKQIERCFGFHVGSFKNTVFKRYLYFMYV